MTTHTLHQGTIKNLQKHIEQNLIRWQFDDESLQERLLLLTEELGELVNACRKLSTISTDTNREITNKPGEEIADMLNLLFAVAIKLNIDVESEYLEKEQVVNKRVYKRS